MDLPFYATPPKTSPATQLAATLRQAIPTLDTERLQLRAPDMHDFPVLKLIIDSPRGTGIGGPMSTEDAWYDFTQMTATWALRGHGWWTVTRRSDGATLGFAGIGAEPGDQEPELGYFVIQEAEGHGIAREAAEAVLGFARERLGMTTLISYIHFDNERSIALAERLGAIRDTEAEVAIGHDALAYRHDLTKEVLH